MNYHIEMNNQKYYAYSGPQGTVVSLPWAQTWEICNPENQSFVATKEELAPTDNTNPDFFKTDYIEYLYTEYGVYRGIGICSQDGYDSHAVCDKPYAKGKEGTTSYSVVNHLPIYGKWSYTTENMNIYGAVKNLYGNIWYKVKDDNGNDGFISSNDVEYVGPWPFIQNYVTTGGWSLADGMELRQVCSTMT